MPKNDVPNVSVLMMPWGLDITVNAEIKASQEVMIQRVRRSPAQFDNLRKQHGEIGLQTWLKLEHQPRFYHWIPKAKFRSNDWDAICLIRHFDEFGRNFVQQKESHLSWIIRTRNLLSDKQKARLESANQNLNLAIRLVKTIEKNNSFWRTGYLEQVQTIEREVKRMRPFIDFFLE